jgi:hypothetical protein
MVEELVLSVSALQSPEGDLRVRGAFEDAWKVLINSADQVLAIVIDVHSLKLLQRSEFKRLFHGEKLDCAFDAALSALSPEQVGYLKYLASTGGNLMVFFRVRNRQLLRALEVAVRNHFESAAMPDLPSSGLKCLSLLLKECRDDVVLAFAHDGEPLFCFGHKSDACKG